MWCTCQRAVALHPHTKCVCSVLGRRAANTRQLIWSEPCVYSRGVAGHAHADTDPLSGTREEFLVWDVRRVSSELRLVTQLLGPAGSPVRRGLRPEMCVFICTGGTVVRGGGGGVAKKSERDNRDVVEQLSDLRVTRLYNPVSSACFIVAEHQHVCLPASHPPALFEEF